MRPYSLWTWRLGLCSRNPPWVHRCQVVDGPLAAVSATLVVIFQNNKNTVGVLFSSLCLCQGLTHMHCEPPPLIGPLSHQRIQYVRMSDPSRQYNWNQTLWQRTFRRSTSQLLKGCCCRGYKKSHGWCLHRESDFKFKFHWIKGSEICYQRLKVVWRKKNGFNGFYIHFSVSSFANFALDSSYLMLIITSVL